MTNENNLNIDLDNKKVTDDIKKEMKKANTIHIHKTSEEGKEVDVDIDKNKKTINVNINKDGKKKNVKIGFSGIKVKDGKNPVFDQKYPYAGDYNAWIRFSQKYGLYLVKKNYVYVRKHPNQASNFLNLKTTNINDESEIYVFWVEFKNKNALLKSISLVKNLDRKNVNVSFYSTDNVHE